MKVERFSDQMKTISVNLQTLTLRGEKQILTGSRHLHS